MKIQILYVLAMLLVVILESQVVLLKVLASSVSS